MIWFTLNKNAQQEFALSEAGKSYARVARKDLIPRSYELLLKAALKSQDPVVRQQATRLEDLLMTTDMLEGKYNGADRTEE